VTGGGADLGLDQFVRAEHAKYEPIVKRSGAKAD
jgi:hypothetical protein